MLGNGNWIFKSAWLIIWRWFVEGGEVLQKRADELWILNTCKDSRASNLHEFSMWWNVINDKSSPFCLISVTTSDNKYHLSDGITENVSCHFALLIVLHVTLDVLGRGWHSQWLPVEIISPLWALWTRSVFKRGSDDSLFWWRTAQTSLKVVYISLAGHRSCEVAAVWKVPIPRPRGRWGQQVSLLPEPALIRFSQKELLLWWTAQDVDLVRSEWRLILGLVLSQLRLLSSAIKAEISRKKYRVLKSVVGSAQTRFKHFLSLWYFWYSLTVQLVYIL